MNNLIYLFYNHLPFEFNLECLLDILDNLLDHNVLDFSDDLLPLPLHLLNFLHLPHIIPQPPNLLENLLPRTFPLVPENHLGFLSYLFPKPLDLFENLLSWILPFLSAFLLPLLIPLFFGLHHDSAHPTLIRIQLKILAIQILKKNNLLFSPFLNAMKFILTLNTLKL